MIIKNWYVAQFHELINKDDFDFNSFSTSTIFQRRLLNYLDIMGYGYSFRHLVKVFIKKDDEYLERVKLILGDLGILSSRVLEEDVIYSPKGRQRYKREELIDDIQNNIDTRKRAVFDINIYLQEVNKEIEKNNCSIRTSLMCEELIRNTPVITKGIVKCLDNIYMKGIYTVHSPDILRLLASARKKKMTSKEMLIESYGGKYDYDFISRIIELYDFKVNDDILDEVINRVINSRKFYFTERLIPVIYDFFKRYKDINALDKLVYKSAELKISLKKYNISNNDMGELLKFYSNMEIYNEKRIEIVHILNEYGDLKLR